MALTGHHLDRVGRQCLPGHGVAEYVDDRRVRPGRGGRPAQQHRVPALEAQAGRVRCDVRAGLVDDPDHAEGNPDLPQFEPVGQPRTSHHLPDRVREPGDLSQPAGHLRDPGVVQAEAVQQRRRRTCLPGALHVVRVGRQHPRNRPLERVGHRQQRGVLVRPGGQSQRPRRYASTPGAGQHGLVGRRCLTPCVRGHGIVHDLSIAPRPASRRATQNGSGVTSCRSITIA